MYVAFGTTLLLLLKTGNVPLDFYGPDAALSRNGHTGVGDSCELSINILQQNHPRKPQLKS